MNGPVVPFRSELFGASESVTCSRLGPPTRMRKNHRGESELSWEEPAVVARFGEEGLVELSLNEHEVVIGNRAVPFASLRDVLREKDQNVFAAAGFYVSPMFCIAFDPEFPCWVTYFSSGRLAAWKEIANAA